MADIQVTLTAEEGQWLQELLERVLKDIKIEEHRTRTPTYREHVVHQEQLLQSVLGKVRHKAAGK